MCKPHVGCLLFVALGACHASSARPTLDLTTYAATTQYVRTGRYEEVLRLCEDFARSFDGVRCTTLGTSGEGRPIKALVVERKPGLPTIVFQGGIHAGEIEGKDAGFAFLADLLRGRVAPGTLDAVSVVFIPVINPDGHERISANNRPNQRGPAEMGFRTTGSRLNLNRDWVKADAPEMRAVLGLWRERDPVLFVDLHTTDGAKFQHDISAIAMPLAPRADDLEETAAALSAALVARLTALGHLPVPFYPSFVDESDPASGFETGEAPPRFSNSYAGVRDRLAVLVETHSWRTYKERVESTYHALQAICEEATRSAARWRQAADAASKASAALANTDVALMWKATKTSHPIEFRGYAYEKRPSEISGGTWLVYDESTPQVWAVPLYDELEPELTVHAPGGGYIVDGGYAALVAPILDAHGVEYEPLRTSGAQRVQTFRAATVAFGAPYEGHQRATLTGAWQPEDRTPDQGAIFVPMAQPLGRLVLHLFEPTLPDSLVQWGFFNTAFERKEYMEEYVAEEEARRMLAADPALRAAFDAALAADPALAKDPAKRLEWFYRRHPAWDERVDLVPVYRVDTPSR